MGMQDEQLNCWLSENQICLNIEDYYTRIKLQYYNVTLMVYKNLGFFRNK